MAIRRLRRSSAIRAIIDSLEPRFLFSVIVDLPVINPGFDIVQKPDSSATTQLPSGGFTSPGLGPGVPVKNATGGPATVSYSDGTSGSTVDIPGWSGTTPSSHVTTGVQNSTPVQYPGKSDNFALINGPNDGEPAQITQTLTGIGLQPNTRYVLSVDIGKRADNSTEAPPKLTLQVGDSLLTPIASEEPAVVSGQFVAWRETYQTGAAPPAGDFTIILGAANPRGGGQVGFDNVKLTSFGPGAIAGRAIDAISGTSQAGRAVMLDGTRSTTTDDTGSFSFPGLPPGTYTITETLLPGETSIGSGGNSRTVVLGPAQEVDEVNFAVLPVPATVGPDLVARLVSKSPRSAVTGSSAEAKVRISNAGRAFAAGSLEARLLLSRDATPSPDDAQVAALSLPALRLDHRGSRTLNVHFSYPADLADGSYRLIAVLDPGGATREAAYANNVVAGTAIALAPAFVSLKARITRSSGALVQGRSAQSTVMVRNLGNIISRGAISVSLYESSDATLDADDVLLGHRSLRRATLPPDGESIVHLNFRTPASASPGSVYVLAVVNDDTAQLASVQVPLFFR